MFIYKITNKVNGKVYIGQTTKTVEHRFKRHSDKYSPNSQYKSVIYLAMQKYGKDNFIVETIDTAQNIESLNDKEIFWIQYYNSLSPNGYNLTTGGNNFHHSEETKRKISKGNKGRKASEITKKRLSESHKGHVVSEETKEKLRQYWKGKPQSISLVNKRIHAVAKHYVFLNPHNQIVAIHNMAKFCRENNLSKSNMSLVANGKQNYHKGWKLYNAKLSRPT